MYFLTETKISPAKKNEKNKYKTQKISSCDTANMKMNENKHEDRSF